MSDSYISGNLETGDGLDIAKIWERQGAISTAEIAPMAEKIDSLVATSILEGGIVRESESKEILVYGILAFVSEETRDDVLQNPKPFQSIDFIRDYIKTGKSVYLGIEAQAKGNRGNGLHAMSVDYWQKSFDVTNPYFAKAINAFLPVFLNVFKGFNIKSITLDTEVSGDKVARELGYTERYDHAEGSRAHYVAHRVEDSGALHNQMIQMGMIYRQPRMRFSLFEQRVMRIALVGRTDQEIAAQLGCSRDAVKQCWRGTYAHAADTVPGFFGHADTDSTQRGPEKRRILLAHVRENIQELRPYSLRREKKTAA